MIWSGVVEVVMAAVLRFVLLGFAAIGFAGAGASVAVARQRFLAEIEHDIGMLGVAAMLFVFGALCTAVAVGLSGVLAFGAVMLWSSYVLMAQHVGLFRIEILSRVEQERSPEEERQVK